MLAMKGLKNRKENKAFLETEGGDKSDMRDYGPFSKGKKPQLQVNSKQKLFLERNK